MFSEESSKASPRQLNQLEFILQFTTDIVYLKNDNNVAVDALSRIISESMLTILSPERIQLEQQENGKLKLLDDNNTLLNPQQLYIDDTHSIYRDVWNYI